MSLTGAAPARVPGSVQGAALHSHGPYAQEPLPAHSKLSFALRIPSGLWIQVGYVLLDVLFVSMNLIIAFYLRFAQSPRGLLSAGHWKLSSNLAIRPYGAILLVYVALVVLFCQSRHLYRTLRERTATGESLAVAWAVASATFLLTAFIFVSGVKIFSRFVVILSGLLNLATLIAWRLARRRLVIRRVTQGVGARNALIVGAGKVGQALARNLERNQVLGYKVKGFVDGNHSGDPRILGRIEDFDRIIRTEFIDEVFITIPSERELVKQLAGQAQHCGLDVKVIPELYDGLGWRAPIHYLSDFPVMEIHSKAIPVLGLFFKRVLDITGAAVSLILLFPVFAVLAVVIKCDTPGPVFYGSPRIGRKGRKFFCYKFRTMVQNADALKEGLRSLNERQGPFFKIANDPRITQPGKLLRRFSLDELPQLWNVFLGEMSLVGPRPHPVDDYERYNLEHLGRLDVKPGITGLWQVTARQDNSFETSMRLDIEYIENWSLWLDVEILLRTLPAVLNGSGA